MTIMLDDDEDSDCLFIDEREPASPKTQTSDNHDTSTGNIATEPNKKTSDLRNVRKNPEPPQVNYLPLMRNYTLNTIKNNLLNSNEGNPRITIRDFARIPDATHLNENRNAALYSLLTENSISTEQHTAHPTDSEALRAQASNNDQRLHVTETWVPTNSNYQRAPGSCASTPQDQRVPIPQNPFGVQNANMPHMPSPPSMKASVIIPNPGNHSGGAMSYGPPPSTQGHNGVNTNFPTAMTNVWPVQNGHQTQMYTDAYNRQYGHNSAAPAEYHEQATAKYDPRVLPPMNCPPGCYCRHQINMSAHPLNPPPTHDSRVPPTPYMYQYSMGMSSNGQSLASTNPHERVPMPNSQNFPWNGYGQAYGTNSIPQNSPYSGRDTSAYFAEMHKQAYLQRNSYRMESMRTETTNVVSASGHVKDYSGVKTTNKRAYTKVSTNNAHIVINTSSEIPASSTHNNVMGDGASVNIPNLAKLKINNAFGTDDTTARKRNANKNTNTSKAKASMPANHQLHAPSNVGIPTRKNTEIQRIDLTSASAEPSMNNIPNLTQPPLNTDAQLTTVTTNTPEANIATVSQYKNVADNIQAPMNKEVTLQPTTMNINNDGAQTVLVEARQSVVNININKASAQIPLIMNQQADMSLNIDKAHVKTTMLNSESDLATLDMTTNTETLQTGAFIQPANNNIKRQIALNLLNNIINKNQTDATPTPKTRVQASSNAYEVKVSTTSTTTERISHNIASKAVLTSATMNAETDSIQGVAKVNSILKTVDHRTETIVTNVGVVNNIPNISIQTLKDILNNAQQISTKTASIDDLTYDNQVSKCDDTENDIDTNPIISHTAADDHSDARIDHEPHALIVGKQDEKLETARKNLARLRAVEHENSSCKHVEKITQRDTENQYQIKITTGLNGEYIAQVTSVSSDRSSVKQEHFQADYSTSNTEQLSAKNNENITHSQRRQETEVLDGNSSIENNQETNEASESRENVTNITRDVAQPNIDETTFFKFQINFFRLVQERLTENNYLELADELRKDILDLIAISDDERAKADMKYKCHMCHNTAIYSPRSLYNKVTNYVEKPLDKIRNCPLCITFRKKYIDILMKYIEIEAPEEAVNSNNSNAAQRADDATINSSIECQSYTENSIPNQEDGLPTDRRQEEYSDLENQLSLITNGVPSSPKKANTNDQAKANAKNVLDVSNTTQDGKSNDFVVKLPRNRLKESTVEALMQCKNFKSNAIQVTLNIALDDNSDKAKTTLEANELRKILISETVTSTIAEQRYTNVNNSTNISVNERRLEVGTIIDTAINIMYGRNDQNKENPRQIRKSISIEDNTGKNSAAQNRNSNPASDNNQDNNNNKEKPCKKRISISAETSTSNPPSENKYRSPSDGNTDTNQASCHKIRKSISVETASTTNPANLNNNDHIDENQENRRKRKSISSETYPEPPKKITNDITTRTNAPHFTTRTLNVASNNKDNHNNIVRECELRKITCTEPSKPSKTNTTSDATSTEANNKGISENLPERTADIVGKKANIIDEKRENNEKSHNVDSLNDGRKTPCKNHIIDEKRENNEKRHNDDTLNDGRKTPCKNHDESGDNATQSVEKALSDCQNTIKENCISNEQELPQVKISGKKKRNKIAKSKDHQPVAEITYEYRCSECTVGFRYLSSCLSHMKNNHEIQNPVVPLHCITMRCAFCNLFVMPKLYNTHIKTAHNDKFTKVHKKLNIKLNMEVFAQNG